MKYRTPPALAADYGCAPETIIGHIKAGRLKAFTLSPPHCTRPRWRISDEAVAEFERLYGNQQTPKPSRRSRRKADYHEYV